MDPGELARVGFGLAHQRLDLGPLRGSVAHGHDARQQSALGEKDDLVAGALAVASETAQVGARSPRPSASTVAPTNATRC